MEIQNGGIWLLWTLISVGQEALCSYIISTKFAWLNVVRVLC